MYTQILKIFLFVFILLTNLLNAEIGFTEEDRINIAILDLKPVGVSKDESMLLTEVLRSEMFKLLGTTPNMSFLLFAVVPSFST